MNALPGFPDYGYLVSEVVQAAHSVGMMGWFWGISWALTVLALAVSFMWLVLGNRLAFLNGLSRVLLASALLIILSRPEGAAVRGQLLSLWSTAHRAVASATVNGVARDFANWMNRVRDAATNAMTSLSLMAIGGVAVGGLAKMGLKGAQEALDRALELRGKMGGAVKGVGPTGAFQRAATLGRNLGWGVVLLVVPYIAAMALSGIMAYLGVALMPLGAGLLAIGSNRLLTAAFSLYLSGVILGVVAPMVFTAAYRTAGQITLPNVYRQLVQAQNEADGTVRQMQAQSQQMKALAEQYADTVKQDPNTPWWRSLGQALADGAKALLQSAETVYQRVTAPISNLFRGLATFIVTGLISILVWFVSIGTLMYATIRITNTIAGFRF